MICTYANFLGIFCRYFDVCYTNWTAYVRMIVPNRKISLATGICSGISPKIMNRTAQAFAAIGFPMNKQYLLECVILLLIFRSAWVELRMSAGTLKEQLLLGMKFKYKQNEQYPFMNLSIFNWIVIVWIWNSEWIGMNVRLSVCLFSHWMGAIC